MKVDIENWGDLTEQFGLVEHNGLLGAKCLSKRLSEVVNKSFNNNVINETVLIECNTKSDALATFSLISVNTNTYVTVYEYNGTAN